MRDALSTLDQVIAFCGETVADDDVQGLLGMVDRRLLYDAVEGVVGHDSRLALDAVRRVDHLGHSFRQFCQELVEAFRALVLLKVVEDPQGLLDVTADELHELHALAARGSVDDLQRALTVLLRAEAELASSSFPRLTVEMALVRLAHLPPGREVAQLVAKLEDLERRLGSGLPAAAPPPASPPRPAERRATPPPPAVEPPPGKKPEAPAAVLATDRGWPGLVDFVKGQRRPRIAAILEQASLMELALPLLQLGLPRGFALDQLQDRDTLNDLTTLASQYFGGPVEIQVNVLEGRATAPPSLVEERQQRESDRQRRLREDALGHPMVKAACTVFDAEVTEVKVTDKGFV